MIFHDVDLLPEHFGNRYECSENPVHSSLYIDKYNYERNSMHADWGGVVMIKVINPIRTRTKMIFCFRQKQ